jgi:hypothetical protein
MVVNGPLRTSASIISILQCRAHLVSSNGNRPTEDIQNIDIITPLQQRVNAFTDFSASKVLNDAVCLGWIHLRLLPSARQLVRGLERPFCTLQAAL